MLFAGRWRVEVYYDILRGIHRLSKTDRRIALSSIGREARVPNNRIRDRLAELVALGLLTSDFSVTRAGYGFCADYLNQIDRFLRKYGLSRGR